MGDSCIKRKSRKPHITKVDKVESEKITRVLKTFRHIFRRRGEERLRILAGGSG